MVFYQCPFCDYNSDRLSNLRNHFNKKNKCDKRVSNTNPKNCMKIKEIKNNNIVKTELESIEFIYIFQEREFIKTNENVYKIGRTARHIKDRLSGYSKGTRIMYSCIMTPPSAKALGFQP